MNTSKNLGEINMTITEYRKIWTWKADADGTLILLSYKGEDKEVIVPDKIGQKQVKIIGEGAFRGKTIEKVIISDGIKRIGCDAFADCQQLIEISLPNSIIKIDDFAFSNTAIRSVKCPSNIKKLGAIFADCANLKEVIFPKKLKIIDRTFMRSGIETIFIPEGVEEIDTAFQDCEKLKIVSIPSTLKHIDVYSFKNCNNIEKIIVAENAVCKYENGFLHTHDVLTAINSVYKNSVIAKEKSAKKIPKTTSTFVRAFISNPDIVEYEIPNGIKTIGFSAFENCTKLKKVIIPETVTTIDHSAFSGCTSLKEINIPNSVSRIGNDAFAYCTSLEKIDLPDSILDIEHCCFYGCSSLKKVKLPNNISTISSSMFVNCEKLTDIDIPMSVKSIEWRAFRNCNSIIELDIPSGVEKIENEAFRWMSGLKKVFIPSSVKKIERNAFGGSPQLTIHCEDFERKKGWSTLFASGSNQIQWGTK